MLSALQELLLLCTLMLWSLKNTQAHYCVQLDYVLTSWMCVAYEKTDRDLHRHIYHRMEGHTAGECSNMKTNWIVWILIGHSMRILVLPGLKVHEGNAQYNTGGTH